MPQGPLCGRVANREDTPADGEVRPSLQAWIEKRGKGEYTSIDGQTIVLNQFQEGIHNLERCILVNFPGKKAFGKGRFICDNLK